jgi:hypothetical protein
VAEVDVDDGGEFAGVQSRGGWLVMIAVICCRQVGGCGGLGRAGLCRRGRPRLSGGVRTVTLMAAMAVAVCGRVSSRLR